MSERFGDPVLVEEASTIGLRPGVWPRAFSYGDHRYTFRSSEQDREGEVLSVLYEDEDGRRLVVVND